ncbi:hypothetical protein EIP91_001369 [Steccherinum ochraceum]|uniref:Carboxylic ester hydrolase n=1 Tax=Steccherinum ochraceum TaxID=92696 RepID=A0A4R0RI11_9APHY|nr:hypothetical protein EIP91_001369 [Steccherinum ochraceum]
MFSTGLALSSLTLLFTTCAVAQSNTTSNAAACSAFTLKNVNNTIVTNKTFYNAGDNVTISNLYNGISTTQLPAFCRIELAITTNATANSTALTEVWLPAQWNNRLIAFGNGGLAGGANLANLGSIAMVQGFAGMSTNTGHQSGPNDGRWGGPHNDNAIIDFSWRALHLSVIVSKEVVQQYYGRAQKKSYYLGCSTGGRQGMKEVQELPDDFDGAVVGSAANWMSHLTAMITHTVISTRFNTTRFIPADTWTNLIHPEVLEQCDELDGLKDGIINDPRRCSFRPETLICKPNQDASTCLSFDQIDTIHKLYTDYYDVNQTYIFGGWYPGSESGMSQYLVNSDPAPLGPQAYKYIIANDTNWDYDDFNFAAIVEAEQVLVGMEALSTNLTAFNARNGKVIHYVGLSENLISAANTLHYYEGLNAWNLANAGPKTDDFYRLFTVPGMEHCNSSLGGFGPIAFGGDNQAAAGMPPAKLDAQHDVLSALVNWVEGGVAPEQLIGTGYVNNSVANGIQLQRPLCKYPAMSRYKSGDPNEASSFVCE